MEKGLFREEALSKFTAPEQLDKLMTVTSLKAWLILLGIGIVLVSAIIWGVTGEVYTKVTTNGALVNSKGIASIPSNLAGRLTDVRVKVGDTVKKGDIIARLDQSELVDKINQQLVKIEADKNGGKDISLLQKQLSSLRVELRAKSYIISPNEGRAVEVHVRSGEYISTGQQVALIENGGNLVRNIVTVLYVPLEQGRTLAPGMEVNVYPSFASREEYGFMKGRIVSISEYPVTQQYIYSMIGSNEVANAFMENGAVLEVVADLVPEASNMSGFKWSASKGPPMKIENGTLCNADIIVGKVRPIEMIVPSIKKLLDR